LSTTIVSAETPAGTYVASHAGRSTSRSSSQTLKMVLATTMQIMPSVTAAEAWNAGARRASGYQVMGSPVTGDGIRSPRNAARSGAITPMPSATPQRVASSASRRRHA
jgi:hypothetical protein